jgi:tryptophan 2,3-dioxygenase
MAARSPAGFARHEAFARRGFVRGGGVLSEGQSEWTSAGVTVDYATYLKLPQLLALQTPLARPAVHDEMLFVIVHQAHELWFKQVICELRAAISQIDSCCWQAASRTLQRISAIVSLLVQHVAVLETMPRAEFQRFRGALGSASGVQSLQFQEIELLSGYVPSQERGWRSPPGSHSSDSANLREVFLRACSDAQGSGCHVRDPGMAGPAAAGRSEMAIVRLRRLYRDPSYEAQRCLADCLLEFDEQVARWRRSHVRLVHAMIGETMGTGGSSGARYLHETLERRIFPELWAARQSELDEARTAGLG